jgi:hypothetical protein
MARDAANKIDVHDTADTQACGARHGRPADMPKPQQQYAVHNNSRLLAAASDPSSDSLSNGRLTSSK